MIYEVCKYPANTMLHVTYMLVVISCYVTIILLSGKLQLTCKLHVTYYVCWVCIINDLTTFYISNISFPKHPLQQQKWIEFVNKTAPKWQPSKTSKLCSRHFTADSFDRSGKIIRLKSMAIPTIQLTCFKHVCIIFMHFFILMISNDII